jgi:hypothetical protein
MSPPDAELSLLASDGLEFSMLFASELLLWIEGVIEAAASDCTPTLLPSAEEWAATTARMQRLRRSSRAERQQRDGSPQKRASAPFVSLVFSLLSESTLPRDVMV